MASQNTTFVIPAEELPLVEGYLATCATASFVGATAFSVEDRPYYDVFLTHCDEADLYNLGRYVGRELERQEGRLAA